MEIWKRLELRVAFNNEAHRRRDSGPALIMLGSAHDGTPPSVPSSQTSPSC
jgi:hypothetical protein